MLGFAVTGSFCNFEKCLKILEGLSQKYDKIYPYGNDPDDKNIRIAPTFPPNDELRTAMDVFCICTKLAACEKLLEK